MTAKETRSDPFLCPDLDEVSNAATLLYFERPNDDDLWNSLDLLKSDIALVRGAVEQGNIKLVCNQALAVGMRWQAIKDKLPHSKGGRRPGSLRAILRDVYTKQPNLKHSVLVNEAIEIFKKQTGKPLPDYDKTYRTLYKTFADIVGTSAKGIK